MLLRRYSRVNYNGLSSLNVLSRREKSSSSDDFQYIQKSSVPTLHFQPSLPRLPIPELSKTCERYLKAQKPLVTPEDFARVEKKIKDFEKDGAQLQKELVDRDSKNKHTSYISKPWFETYLKDRKPLPINYNPLLVFVDDPKSEYNTQLIRASNLLVSSLRFLKSLRANLLEPEVFHLNPKKSDTKMFRVVTGAFPSSLSWYAAYLFKAYPLDMSQYENLFNTSRIPEIGMDRLYHDNTTRHIVVMKGGNFYSMDVLDESGNIIDPNTLFTCLKYILSDTRAPTDFPVGALTSQNRDEWAVARKHLEQIGNSDIFKVIDGSLFNLILDETEPTKDWKKLFSIYLHSDGQNRWFDKSFSLIVGKDGVAGLNFEHSWGDGVAVLRYFQDVYKDSTEKPRIHPDTKPNNSSPNELVTPLEFKLDDKAKQYVSEAVKKYKKTCDSLGVELYEFKNFGRNLCKVHKVSPDCIMQLAFQVAYDKLDKKQVATYESCSTSAFKHGRTETMRPCTIETTNFCKALNATSRPNKEALIGMIKECSKVHGNLIKEAAMGQGFDRHMFALRLIAEERGKVPDIYKDPAYAEMNHYILSTSTLSSDVVLLGGFGPVVKDGFGVGYTILNDRLGAIVTNYPEKTDGRGFIACLEDALNEIYAILK